MLQFYCIPRDYHDELLVRSSTGRHVSFLFAATHNTNTCLLFCICFAFVRCGTVCSDEGGRAGRCVPCKGSGWWTSRGVVVGAIPVMLWSLFGEGMSRSSSFSLSRPRERAYLLLVLVLQLKLLLFRFVGVPFFCSGAIWCNLLIALSSVAVVRRVTCRRHCARCVCGSPRASVSSRAAAFCRMQYPEAWQ